MFNIEILTIVLTFKIWGPLWKDNKVIIYCDNYAVDEVVKHGMALDQVLATCVRNIWLFLLLINITFVATHVQGIENVVADSLSMWQGTDQNRQCLSKLVKLGSGGPVLAPGF